MLSLLVNQPYVKNCLSEIDSIDSFDSYYECITSCYGLAGEDFECVTQCVEVHLKEEG